MSVQAKRNNPQNITESPGGPALDIIVYTDPLCCWSWGAAPHWEQLETHLGDSASWTFRMGGLLPTWSNFSDDVHSVTRPAQMGPVWMHAAQLIGRPIDTRLWHSDPPTSSYPVCVAVKAAELQSPTLGRQYFQRAQRACMQEGRNISKPDVLLDIAAELAHDHMDFDYDRFAASYRGDMAMEAFRQDLAQAQYHRIVRLPTMIICNREQCLGIAGFRPFEEVVRVIHESWQ